MSRSLFGLNSTDIMPPLRSRTPSTNSEAMLPGIRTPFRSAAFRPVPASDASVMPFMVAVLITSQPLLAPYARRETESRRLKRFSLKPWTITPMVPASFCQLTLAFRSGVILSGSWA